MITIEEIKEKIKKIEQDKINYQATIHAFDGMLIVYKELLEKLEKENDKSETNIS